MTNQQKPEALRLADSLELCWGDSRLDEAAAELRRLHADNERLAALVEAQQTAAHVQNPAEIEHVADDVSKNGPESNMARQPAPSAAAVVGTNTKTAELLSTTVGLLIGYREGGARQPYKPGSVVAKVIDEVVDHLKDWPYPEPSPTPQADSAPGAVTVERAIQIAASLGVREYGPNTRNWSFDYAQLARFVAALTAPQADSQPDDKDLVAVPRDLIGAACSAIDKKRDGAKTLAELRRYTIGDLSIAIASAPQADSQPAPDEIVSVAREQGLPETEIEGVFRVNVDDLGRMFAADRAARAPADSVLEDAARLEQIAEAIRDYHYALDTRKHGGVAESAAFNSICLTMGMHWEQGKEADRRTALAANGGKPCPHACGSSAWSRCLGPSTCAVWSWEKANLMHSNPTHGSKR